MKELTLCNDKNCDFMKVAIMEEFSRIGGGQKFAQIISEMLKETGFKISLITDRSHNFIQGHYDKIIETNFSFKEGQNTLSILYKSLLLRKELDKANEFDLKINNHPNVFMFNGDINSLHSISIVEPLLDEKGEVKNKNLLRILKISNIYKIYENALFWAPTEYNSNISRKVFEKLNIEGTSFNVIPIPITYLPDINLNEKKDQILIFGRISREKELDTSLEIAKKTTMKLIIAGAVNTGNEDYYKNLLSHAPQNVTVIPNPSEYEKDLLFRESRIFLHLRKRENFPISVLEAISYGCVPVVPKNGGTWTDIVELGKYGYGYSNISEAINAFTAILYSSQQLSKVILNSRDRFSYEKFKKQYLEMIERQLAIKES